MLSPGAAIGRYVIHKKLAEGGMAEVYLASAVGPEGFAKDVVIKVVRSFLASDQQFIDMFIAEARLSSRLNHANVVQIFDFGKAEDSYYLAMEYVRGASLWDLRKRCREQGVPFPPTLAAEISAQVARGLQYAHSLTDRGQSLGLVHRDVTPHNVLLSFDGAVKLTDFGIAKAGTTQTAPGILKGKFAYMSPEQSRGDRIDARTDVFALGIVLWELLTGGRLFDADSEVGVLRAVQSAVIVPPERLNPEVPPDLSAIVLKALARPLDERYQTAFELERALAMYVLQHADSVDDTSSSRFLQQMFRQEYEAVNSAAPFDEVAHGPTLAVNRAKELPGPSIEEQSIQRADGNEATRPPTSRDDLQLSAATASEPAAPAVGGLARAHQPSQKLKPVDAKPKTDLMPAHRPSSRKLPAPSKTVEPAPPVTLENSIPVDVALELPRRPLAPIFAVLAGLALAAGTGWWLLRADPAPLAPVVAAPVAVAAAPSIMAEPKAEPLVAEVDAGPQVLAVTPPGMMPVDAGATTEVAGAKALAAVTGAPKQRVIQKGKLEVRAKPFATVSLDGRRLGEVEGVRFFTVNAGLHELTFAHPAKTKTEPVEVKAGSTSTISFDVSVP